MEDRELRNNVDLDKVILLTLEQAKVRYNIGRNNIKILADEIGAAVPVGASGGKILFNRKKLDAYFENL